MVAPPHFAWPKPAASAPTRRRPQRPNCPHCGSRLLMAEQARFNLAGRIDHVWACDDCGTEFETFIALTREAVA
jgi:RNase P subunit RPR2